MLSGLRAEPPYRSCRCCLWTCRSALTLRRQVGFHPSSSAQMLTSGSTSALSCWTLTFALRTSCSFAKDQPRPVVMTSCFPHSGCGCDRSRQMRSFRSGHLLCTLFWGFLWACKGIGWFFPFQHRKTNEFPWESFAGRMTMKLFWNAYLEVELASLLMIHSRLSSILSPPFFLFGAAWQLTPW